MDFDKKYVFYFMKFMIIQCRGKWQIFGFNNIYVYIIIDLGFMKGNYLG